MSASESDSKVFLKAFGSLVVLCLFVTLLGYGCEAERKNQIERQEKVRQDTWNKYYIDFMADCQRAQRLKTCCLNDFKTSYLHLYEPQPEFCKTPEQRQSALQAKEKSLGRSMGDHVKQGIGVGIGLKVINSIL